MLTASFMRYFIIFCFAFVSTHSGFCQRVLINSSSELYEINKGGLLCSFADVGAFCNPSNATNYIFSIALHKDTFYFLSVRSELYRMKLGNASSCTLLTTFPMNSSFGTTINSLGVDKEGILYAADYATRELYKYDPHTNVKTMLGILNASPAGDLMFYRNKLLMAANDGSIYDVNLSNPSASTVYIKNTGTEFFGLISVPFDCTRNKYYGIQWAGTGTRLYEIDLENRQILGAVCDLPFSGYDAASNVDDGNTLGVTIDSLIIQPACFNNDKANLNVKAYSATSGNLIYTLDDTNTNTTGNFSQLNEGVHRLSVKNGQNCVADTVFTIYHGLATEITIEQTNPFSCLLQDGSITVAANSGYLPLSYQLDNGNFTNDPVFKNLAGGPHTLRISDARGCTKDTAVVLNYKIIPEFFSSVAVQPTYCNNKTGSITIHLASDMNPSDFSASINNGTPQQDLSFNGLDAGSYLLSILSKSNCRYDTFVNISKLINPPPSISIDVTDQLCFENNGAVALSIAGDYGPYKTNLNLQGISNNLNYKNLAPGMYSLSVIDKNGCSADTSVQVLPYPLVPPSVNVETTQPTCTDLKAGSMIVSVSGIENPYSFAIGNNTYSNHALVTNLSEGQFNLIILNKDLCAVDTSQIILKTKLSPECERIFVPNAFTPNGDGSNETFKPIPGYSIKDFDFKIFNRWGQLVFTSTNKYSSWDGKLSGKPLPSGVFSWVLRYNTISDPSKKIMKGTVLLIR